MIRRTNKYKKNKYGHTERENEYHDENSFEAFREKEEHDKVAEDKANSVEGNTKEWVNKSFGLK